MARQKGKRTATIRMGRSRQRKHGGGKFKSEEQRRWMWATNPSAAKKWAHNRKTRKSDWRRKGRARVSPG